MKLERLGITKTSLIEYPGEICAVLFTAGCNFRCPYCHNPELVGTAAPDTFMPVEEVFDILTRRRRVIGAVSITGGEPLIHDDIGDIVERIRSLDLKVKIDTNGSRPDRLREIHPDFAAVDLKTSPANYGRVLGHRSHPVLDARSVAESVRTTARWVIESGITHEFRTTMVPGIVSREDVAAIAELISGADRYVLAGFRPDVTLEPELGRTLPYPLSVLEATCADVSDRGVPCSVRDNSISARTDTRAEWNPSARIRT